MQEIETSQYHNAVRAFLYGVAIGLLAIGLARNRKRIGWIEGAG
jgi:hypothetical protein